MKFPSVVLRNCDETLIFKGFVLKNPSRNVRNVNRFLSALQSMRLNEGNFVEKTPS